MQTSIFTVAVLGAFQIAGWNISFKFIGGLAMGCVLAYLGYKAILAIASEREGEGNAAKKENIMWAVIKFVIGVCIALALQQLGIISFTDITAAINAAQ